MRRPILAVLLILLVAGSATAQPRSLVEPAPVAQAPSPTEMTDAGIAAWRKAQIKAGDYAFLMDWDDGSIFLKEVRGFDLKQGVTRLWVREEYFKQQLEDGVAFRSDESLVAIDCPGQRLRVLTIDSYPQVNLDGEPSAYDAQAPQWTYPRPESLEERLTYAVCIWIKDRQSDPTGGRR